MGPDETARPVLSMSGFEWIGRPVDARRRRQLRDEARERHAGKHRGDEDEGGGRAESERSQRWPRTEACQSPADAEDGGTDDNFRIDVVSRWNIKAVGEDGAHEFQDAAEADESHSHRAGHHKSEARIPRPGRNAAD